MSLEHGTLTGEPVYLKFFDVSDAGFAWREPLREKLRERRMELEDKFIFDILLEAGGIERPWTLFPPRALEDLELLLQAIELSDYDNLKKECLVYYLLKWHNDGRESRFQEERSIPSQYANLADAYWHLDAGCNIPHAVSLLSDERLNGDYSSKILQTISLSPNPVPLIVQYVRTAKPRLISQADIWIYTHALAELSFLDAWQFQRTFNETSKVRTMLLNNLLEWCISSTPRPAAIQALLSLPLSPSEERFLHKYALEPSKTLARTSIYLLRDLVCVRLIQSGKHAEAIKIDHEFAASTLNESKSEAEPRRKMVRELYEALSTPERTLLDAELGGLTRGKPIPNGIPKPQPKATPPIKDIGLSESREEVPRLPLLGQLNGKPPIRGGPSLRVSASNSIYGLSSSTNGAPPILPISTGTPTANRPRPSFNLSTSLSSSISRRPQFPTISISDNGKSGSRLPPSVSQPLPDLNSFSPASRRANAFYKPPPVAPQGVKRSFESSLGHGMDVDGEEEVGMEMPKDTHESDDTPIQNEQKQQESDEAGWEQREREQKQQESDEAGWEQRELGFSVFGSAKQSAKKTTIPPSPQGAPVVQKGRRVPPGAFASDEENEPEIEAKEPTPPPTTSRTRTSHRRTHSRTTTQVAQAPEPKRARRSEHPKPRQRQSVPGTLVNSDEEEEEEEDQVAPLPSPPRRGTTRRARDTTPASDAGDEEVGQTRRRSSRLSSTGDSAKKAPSGNATAGKAKKSTRTTGKRR